MAGKETTKDETKNTTPPTASTPPPAPAAAEGYELVGTVVGEHNVNVSKGKTLGLVLVQTSIPGVGVLTAPGVYKRGTKVRVIVEAVTGEG